MLLAYRVHAATARQWLLWVGYGHSDNGRNGWKLDSTSSRDDDLAPLADKPIYRRDCRKQAETHEAMERILVNQRGKQNRVDRNRNNDRDWVEQDPEGALKVRFLLA